MTRPRRVITTTEVRRNLNAVIEQIRRRREPTIIEKSGAPVVVILSVAEYEQLLRYKRLAMFDHLTREIGEGVERSGLSEKELMADLEDTKRQVSSEKYA